MLAYLLQGLLLGTTAAAQPGPLQAFLLSQTIKNGARKTLPAAFAPLISDGPILIIVLLVLTQTPGWFLNGLRIAGGMFLLYLAWGAYRSYRTAAGELPAPPETSGRSVIKAALMNLLSPNPWIFWTTIAGPILIAGWRESPASGLGFLLGFYVALCGGFMAFIALFALTKRLDPRVEKALSLFSAVALALFGLYQLWQGLATLAAGA